MCPNFKTLLTLTVILFATNLSGQETYTYERKAIKCNLTADEIRGDTMINYYRDSCDYIRLEDAVDGIWKIIRKADGKVERTFTLKDGKLNGKLIEYGKGLIWKVYYFSNDTLNGLFVQHNIQNPGLIEALGEYRNGEPYGTFKGFYINGSLCCFIIYKNGRIKKKVAYDEKGVKISFTVMNEIRARQWGGTAPPLFSDYSKSDAKKVYRFK